MSSVVDTAKPVNAVLVVDADQRGPVEVLTYNGSRIDLWVVLDCRLVPVIGPDGAPYLFDTGYRGNGTGAICADIDGDGRRDLVDPATRDPYFGIRCGALGLTAEMLSP